ncbi:hypothetical protein BQ8420_28720 [Nocardiopsis sp. JB363]|nr:hypothetical protein BQ8420_28720 [Nocardiopsis sp. JB363]
MPSARRTLIMPLPSHLAHEPRHVMAPVRVGGASAASA